VAPGAIADPGLRSHSSPATFALAFAGIGPCDRQSEKLSAAPAQPGNLEPAPLLGAGLSLSTKSLARFVCAAANQLSLAPVAALTHEYWQMYKPVGVVCLCFILGFTGCKKKDTTPPPPKNQADTTSAQPGKVNFDACGLITKQEIETIEGSPLIDTKNSGRLDAGLRFTQCFYTTKEFSRSVSLAVTQADPRATPPRNIKELWEETFGTTERPEKENDQDKEKRESLRQQKGEREEEERRVPPKKIEGAGEEAFWAASRVGGALYVFKKDAYVRVSVGGPDAEDKKIEKCKALAEKALSRL